MKIVHVTRKIGDVRMRKAAHYARERGHDVHVVMGFESRDKEIVLRDGKPTARNAPPLRILPPAEWIDGLPTYRANRIGENLLTAAVASLKPDVVHAHELDSLWPLVSSMTEHEIEQHFEHGVRLEELAVPAQAPPFPLVYDAHEWERDRPRPSDFSPSAHSDRLWMEWTGIHRADAVITVSPALARATAREYSIPAPNLVVNAPCAPTRPLERDAVRTVLNLRPDEVAVMFVGNVTPDRKISELARAVRQLGAGYRLFVLGRGGFNAELDYLLDSCGCEWLEPQPHAYLHEDTKGLTMLDWVAAADVGYNGAELHFGNWRMGAPNKVFEYGFAGTPFVTAAMQDVITWCRDYRLGVVSDCTVADLKKKIPAVVKAGRIPELGRARFVSDFAHDRAGGPDTLAIYRDAIAAFEDRRGAGAVEAGAAVEDAREGAA